MKTRSRAVVALLCISLAACTTVKPVPVSVPDLSQSVQPDDYIEIKLVGGTTIALTVTEVTTESIAGYQKGEENPSRYAKDQMVEINKFPKDGSKTTKLVLGIVAAAALLIRFVLLPALGGL